MTFFFIFRISVVRFAFLAAQWYKGTKNDEFIQCILCRGQKAAKLIPFVHSFICMHFGEQQHNNDKSSTTPLSVEGRSIHVSVEISFQFIPAPASTKQRSAISLSIWLCFEQSRKCYTKRLGGQYRWPKWIFPIIHTVFPGEVASNGVTLGYLFSVHFQHW